ncbi:PAS-domain containing protein [Magnetospirillum sp. UT-4]|uniref:PAS-domain containing protein n=1 Tax=Magnetospirillum sp. UT-4 TaxID=2681467 RepID=UPI00137E1AA2|nr:PAS-domain containing protein [Magnetospirillum sp. UT-4]CAA7620030.1 Transcriptional regulator [Magnetospirillum sp. UT-4]
MELLQETLDALDVGVIRFDAQLRLLTWNRPLVEIMGFPPDLLRPGTPFLDFVAFNIARGEHGGGEARLIVSQRLASVADSYSRRRPDGTLIRVVGKRMPDGGILKMFTRAAAAAEGPAPALTAREREALLWAAEGKTAWETATILGISPKTVEFHLANCGRKLGTATKSQTILAAARKGLLPL